MRCSGSYATCDMFPELAKQPWQQRQQQQGRVGSRTTGSYAATSMQAHQWRLNGNGGTALRC